MLACARLGVIIRRCSAVLAGAACGHRIADSQSPMPRHDGSYYRNGELIDHKVKADQAIEAARKEASRSTRVLVWRGTRVNTAPQSPMVEAATSSLTS